MKFRIEIPEMAVMKCPREQWLRMADYIEDNAPTIVGHQCLTRDVWVYTGDATNGVVAVLTAAAQGHDVEAVLDWLADQHPITP